MAVTLTEAQLREALHLGGTQPEIDDATRLLAYAKAEVERFAPDAPAVAQNEAVIRLAGYLFDTPSHRAVVNPLGLSGAIRMLLPYKPGSVASTGAAATTTSTSGGLTVEQVQALVEQAIADSERLEAFAGIAPAWADLSADDRAALFAAVTASEFSTAALAAEVTFDVAAAVTGKATVAMPVPIEGVASLTIDGTVDTEAGEWAVTEAYFHGNTLYAVWQSADDITVQPGSYTWRVGIVAVDVADDVGLTAVATDATLTGSGTSDDPLKVTHPFTPGLQSKLDGIEAGAQVNLPPPDLSGLATTTAVASEAEARMDGDDALDTKIGAIRQLPPFPAEGSRAGKIPKFAGDVLDWADDAEGTGTGDASPPAAVVASANSKNLGTTAGVSVEVASIPANKITGGVTYLVLTELDMTLAGRTDALTFAEVAPAGGRNFLSDAVQVLAGRSNHYHMTTYTAPETPVALKLTGYISGGTGDVTAWSAVRARLVLIPVTVV